MPWNPDEARSRHPTGTVARALGLEPEAVAETLTWARARSDELISTLDDGELLSLLDPPGTRGAPTVSSIGRSASTSERPTVRLAKFDAPAKTDERPTETLARVGDEEEDAKANERPTVNLRTVSEELGAGAENERPTVNLRAVSEEPEAGTENERPTVNLRAVSEASDAAGEAERRTVSLAEMSEEPEAGTETERRTVSLPTVSDASGTENERRTVSLGKVSHEPKTENERPTVSLPKVDDEAIEEPKTRRATLELPALDPDSLGEDLYGLQELDAIDLPPLEWGGTAPGPTQDQDIQAESGIEFIEPEFIETEPDDPADMADTVATVRTKRKRVKDRRTLTRYSLVEPAVIEVGSWSNLVTLYTKDISCGGMFVQTTNPPQRDAEVGVQLLLPGDAGTLDFDGVVVHVVSPELAETTGRVAGFGLQFRGLTPERRRALQRIIDRAKAADSPGAEAPKLHDLGLTPSPGGRGLRLTLDATERRHLRELQAELVAMGDRDDLEVLGLTAHGEAAELRQAFDRLARRWHPSVAHRDSPPEVRKLATEIFLRIEQAYQRLSVAPRPEPEPPMDGQLPPPPAFSTDGPRPETVIGPAPTAPPGYTRKPDPRANQARRVLERTETLTRKLEQPPADPPPVGSTRVPASPGGAEGSARSATRGVDRKGPAPASSPPRVGSAHRGRPRRSSPVPRPDAPGKGLDRRAAKLARPRRFVPDPSTSSRKSSNPIKEALDLIAAKRYGEAVEHLERVLEGRPQPRLRVLLSVVRARQAIQDRDFTRAREHYQKVLELDPNNALAERELLMLSAVGR